MPGEDDLFCGPRWRVILEERWRDRLQEVTELSVAYHGATAETPGGITDKHARRLLREAVAARRRLADTEDALTRLAAGGFGKCEECGALIPKALLAAAPESRYCADCTAAADVTVTGTAPVALANPVPAPRRAAAGIS
jgi:RNA polymerase-binding transcription factor DksA